MSRAGRIECWLVGMVLVLHAGLLAWSGWRHSPTVNEPGHLVAGISHWQFGRFELYRVNPPLVRMVSALPVLAVGCRTDWAQFYEGPGARPVFSMGEDWIAANGEGSLWLMTLARWGCIPFSLVGGLACFLFARALWGRVAGLVALILWCFSPNILGHGSLITPDVPAAAMGILAGYCFWHWLNEPDWSHAFAAGLTLGLAELTKMTWIILFGLWPVLWLAWRFSRERRVESREQVEESPELRVQSPEEGRGSSLVQLGLILLLGLYVLNLGYGFDGTFTRLKDFTFVSNALTGRNDSEVTRYGNRFAESWLGEIRIPLPKQYVLGADVQRRDFEGFAWPSYLRGQWKETGWWYYYLYGLGIKVPLGTLLLCGIAVVAAAICRIRKTDPRFSIQDLRLKSENPSAADRPFSACCAPSPALDSRSSTLSYSVLLVPALSMLVLVSSQTGFNHHLRYVWPVLPFLFVFAGRSVAEADVCHGRIGLRRGLAGVCVLWTVVSSLCAYPRSLSYFNELVGGSKNGHKHLIHSSLDWGHDLLYVKEWLDTRTNAEPFYLAYYGALNPELVGISYELPPQKPPEQSDEEWLKELPPGWYAISVNYLCGDRRAVPNGHGQKKSVCENAYTAFRSVTPTRRLGGSIWLFHLSGPQNSDL